MRRPGQTLAVWLLLLAGGRIRIEGHADRWPCDSDADGPSDEKCSVNHLSGRACMPLDYCLGVTYCGDHQLCVDHRRTEVECVQTWDATCHPYPCNSLTHTCRDSCETYLECTSGWGCKAGRCVPGDCTPSTGLAECGLYQCVNAFCLTECTEGAECPNGAGCVESECRLGTPIGGSCAIHGTCASRLCLDGVCAYAPTVCANRECGEDRGVDCGICTGDTYCDDDSGRCVAPCERVECGMDAGVDCGDGGEQAVCEDGVCEAVCVFYDCGEDRGVPCGECAADAVCINRTCRPMECTPGAYFGDQNVVYRCDADGMGSWLQRRCEADECCAEDGSTASCEPQVCTPTATGCDGSRLTTCNEAGSGWGTGGTDCAELDLDCTFLGCVDTAVSVVTDAMFSYLGTSFSIGNFYGVEAAVTLVSFSQYLELGSSQSLTWFAYEGDSEHGRYTEVFSSTRQHDQGEGWLDSGDVGVVLQAGHYYLVGVSAESEAYKEYFFGPSSENPDFGAWCAGYFDTEPRLGYVDFDGPTDRPYAQTLVTATYP